MRKLFSQMVCPFWIVLESCAEVLSRESPPAMKFDTLVSRTIHALNRSQFVQDGPTPFPSQLCVEEHVEPESCRQDSATIGYKVNGLGKEG